MDEVSKGCRSAERPKAVVGSKNERPRNERVGTVLEGVKTTEAPQ